MELTLSQNICKLRKEHHLTQEQLAEALGVTFASVSKWERGVATPELQLIAKMADFFGVSLDALVGFTLQSGSIQETEEELHILQKQKKYREGLEKAEKALLRYPNNFRIVYRAGQLYALAGMEKKQIPTCTGGLAFWSRPSPFCLRMRTPKSAKPPSGAKLPKAIWCWVRRKPAWRS